jgi:phospholipid/cholesterol/gamma-HCH transport system permease protein
MSTEAQVPGSADPDFEFESQVNTGIDLVSPVRNALREIGEPIELFRYAVMSVIRRPVGFWGDTVDYAHFILRRAVAAAIMANVAYSGIVITFSSAILLFLGAANRVGVPYFIFTMREIIPFLCGTVSAGVIGASITAELGARKIRGELDALRVMGQDPVRNLVIPRLIATMFMVALMAVFVSYFSLAMGVLTSEWIARTSTGAYIDASLGTIVPAEIFGVIGKSAIIGLFIGLVCANKGLNTPPGSEGLGWAVNRAVVICTLATFIIDVIFNMILQGLVPSLSVSR